MQAQGDTDETRPRLKRRYRNKTGFDDSRSRPARDRDRVLYSSAFRRLSLVTQVTDPLQAHIFHNRLTHSLEVAQIARRIAEKLLTEEKDPQRKTQLEEDHLNADVVEAAALIHDIGHPPFGHTGEAALDDWCKSKVGRDDGFEGNAQSFRIVTLLSVHRRWPDPDAREPDKPETNEQFYPGLDLCRATLNAALKYPWSCGAAVEDKNVDTKKKYGAYLEDQEYFIWVRNESPAGKCLEAAIVDYADDVANAVHDIADFYRAGLIPLELLASSGLERDNFFKNWPAAESFTDGEMERANTILREMPTLNEHYEGTLVQRARLRDIATTRIGLYIDEASIDWRKLPPKLSLANRATPDVRFDIELLKRVFKYYIHENPRLTTQQVGQQKIIKELLDSYLDAAQGRLPDTIIPRALRHIHDYMNQGLATLRGVTRARLAVDIVSSFTDIQAIEMHRRLTGIDPGSVSDIVVW